jgi:selenocysteine-specific elongation factor
MEASALDRALDALAEADSTTRLTRTACLSRVAAERLMADLIRTLDAFHAADPLQPGMPRAALTGTLPNNTHRDAGAAVLALLVERGEIEIQSEIVSRVGFSSSLDTAQTRLAEELATRLSSAGLEAPTMRTLVEELRADERNLRELAHFLERNGRLVAAPDELFFDRQAVTELIHRVVAHFEEHDELDTQTLKSMIGTSRRTAMPLMALLDDLQVTRRDGSVRRLLNREPRW